RRMLRVGAPGWPCASNFVMRLLDARLHQLCQNEDITYSRYADDLTFSTSRRHILFDLPDMVSHELMQAFDGTLSINKHKTIFSSRASNRHVTGICLTNESRLSLGRAKKRYIKHLVHQFLLDRLSTRETAHLLGWLAFASDIEPAFILTLKNKY